MQGSAAPVWRRPKSLEGVAYAYLHDAELERSARAEAHALGNAPARTFGRPPVTRSNRDVVPARDVQAWAPVYGPVTTYTPRKRDRFTARGEHAGAFDPRVVSMGARRVG